MTTAIVADDEPLLRAQLVDTLAVLWPELRVVGQAGDGEAAVALVSEHRPDIAFLDIEMPGMTGLEAAREIRGLAHVVFITAYQQYAVDAFERGAIDYVLKPASQARLADTVARLRARSGGPTDAARMEETLAALARALGKPERPRGRWLQASVGNRIRLIRHDDVLFVQSDLKYSRIVTADGESLVRKPLKELLDELDPQRFWQVHRGTIVNVDAVTHAVREEGGHLSLAVRGSDEKVEVSRSYQHLFRDGE